MLMLIELDRTTIFSYLKIRKFEHNLNNCYTGPKI